LLAERDPIKGERVVPFQGTFLLQESALNKFRHVLAAMAVAVLPMAANAAPVSVDTWYNFGFDGIGSDLRDGTGTVLGTNPDAVTAPAGPWTFTLTSAATLFVVDLFLSLDQFELFNFGTSLGLTSAPNAIGGGCSSDITCAIGNLDYSRGAFALAAGTYSITGTQVAGIEGAGAFIIETAAVPVPAAGVLLFGALGMLGAVRLRKSRKA